MNPMPERTIAAISTPVGEGGIGVIRISGSDADIIADRCFRAFSGEKLTGLPGYRALYGEIRDGETVLDDAVALVFRAPKSYTGENVVELSVHGGRLITKSVLRTVLRCGAAAAAPGEFTKRAFLNGKVDLTRAESVMGLISAKNDAALRMARAAHTGRTGRAIGEVTERLLETAASLAAYADYPDEDIPALSPKRFSALLETAAATLGSLLSAYDAGRLVREGIDCVIAGKPNVGKSTLMNLLSGCDRSIVTEIAGTTRDVVEDTVTVGDVTLRLADTAGIRDTDDPVERAGVDRARQRLENAGLILAVFDGAAALDADDRALLGAVRDKRTLIILNKSDLPQALHAVDFAPLPCVEISARQGDGLPALTEKIARITETAGLDPDAAVLLNERQRACAERAFDAVKEAKNALDSGCTLDAVGVCVDDALSALFELTGQRVTNEVTDEVFRRFCVGK